MHRPRPKLRTLRHNITVLLLCLLYGLSKSIDVNSKGQLDVRSHGHQALVTSYCVVSINCYSSCS